MRKLFASIGVAVAIGSGAFALDAVLPAGASTSHDPPPTSEKGEHGRRHSRAHKLFENGVQVAADTIGISEEDLKQALKDGESVASVAEANGVDPQTVMDALVQAGTQKLDEAVANGRIKEERAAKLKERLPDAAARFVNRSRAC